MIEKGRLKYFCFRCPFYSKSSPINILQLAFNFKFHIFMKRSNFIKNVHHFIEEVFFDIFGQCINTSNFCKFKYFFIRADLITSHIPKRI